jgi:hypothetical protein
MRNWITKAACLGVAAAMPLAVKAQAPTPKDGIVGHALDGGLESPITSYDQFVISSLGQPFALHHQNLVEGSEMVTLAGIGLRRGVDYSIDYASGILKILTEVTTGQVLRVSYQPKATAQPLNPGDAAIHMTAPAPSLLPKTASSFSDFLGLQPNSQGFVVGGTSSLNAATGQTTTSPFIAGSESFGVGHGTVSIGYADVGSRVNFAQNDLALDSGTTNSLQAEAGVKKLAVAVQGVDFGSTKVNDTMRFVSDGQGSIMQTDANLQNGPLTVSYSGQNVSRGFMLYSAMPQADRSGLIQSAGLNIQDVSAQYRTKTATVGFTSDLTTDSEGQRIQKEDFSLSSQALKVNAGQQSVGMLFSQFGSLPSEEQQALASQAGTNKEWLSLETAPVNKTGQPLKVSALSLTGPMGSYVSSDLSVGAKGWSLQAGERRNNNAFAFQPDIDDKRVGDDVATVAKMYAPSGITPSEADKSMYLFGNLDRYFVRFTDQPSKVSSLDAEGVMLKGASDHADIETIIATLKNADLTIHHTHVGENFFESNQLMDFEQQKLGMDLGIDRTDATGDLKLSKSAKLAFNMMNTNTQQGAAIRDNVEYSDKRIDLSYSTKDIAAGFGTVAMFNGSTGLTDPDIGTLAALNGFKDQLFQGKWQPSAKLSIQTQWEDEHNDTTNQNGFDHVINATWDPNKTTHLGYSYIDTESYTNTQATDPFDVLFNNRMSSLIFTKDFGKAGKLQLNHEETGITDPGWAVGAPPMVGQQAPGPDPTLPQGNASEDALTYTASLDKKTQVQTQDTMTRFGDGTKEDITANTISRALTPHFGLSYTNTTTLKPGTNNDENRNNYGFWLDLYKGIRFSYGFVRDLNEFSGNNSTTTIGLSPGDAGPIHLDAVNQGVNSWDNLHNQVTSNYALHNTKPFNFLIFKNLSFNVNLATQSDYSAYSQRNDVVNVGGKVGANTFMVQYKSQMDQFAKLGTERFLLFQTDPNPKKWIEASIKMKQRDTPETGAVLIRDYSITVRPIKNLELSNHMLTNPEVEFRPDVIMGSVTSPWRVNQYKADYKVGASTSVGATYEDRRDDSDGSYFRTAGVDMQLFRNSGSPLTLWYGMEQGGGGAIPHQYAERFYIRYFQQPSQNQVFNLFLGNLDYTYAGGAYENKYNWSVFGQYEYLFW